jgi:hypothetical protein
MPEFFSSSEIKCQAHVCDHYIIGEIAHVEEFADQWMGKGAHEDNGGLKTEETLFKGDESRVQVTVHEHEIQLFGFAIQEDVKDERIKVPKKREKPVLRPACTPGDKGVNGQDPCGVSQKEETNVRNTTLVKKEDQHPYQQQVPLSGVVNEPVAPGDAGHI